MAQRKLPTHLVLSYYSVSNYENFLQTLKYSNNFIIRIQDKSFKAISVTFLKNNTVGNTVTLRIEEGEFWKGKHLGRMHIMQIKFQRRRNASLFAYEKSLHVYHSILHKKLKFHKLVYTSK